MKTSNISSIIKRLFMNTHPQFDDESFTILKERIKMFLYYIDCVLLNFVLNDHFVPTHSIDREVVNKD